MSKDTALLTLEGFNRQASLIAPAFAQSLPTIFRSLASANYDEENLRAKARNNEILAAYGFPENERKPFPFAEGFAFIPVTGSLINRFSNSWGYVTGYNYIRSQLALALADDDVKVVVFDVNSGGGMVQGCFELCNDIFASRDIKPSVAVVDANSYSAAYAIASSASSVYMTPSGGVGSIGALCMHMNIGKLLDEYGVEITLIHSGDHKVDGNMFESLPENVRADMQKSVDVARESFVSLVARNRGLDTKVVYDTEAQVYSAEEGLALGLVDAIIPPTEALSAFLSELSGSKNDKEIIMSNVTQTGAETQNQAQTQAEKTVDVAAERQAERTRISSIVNCEEAKGKMTLANHLALDTEMSVDAAKQLLAKAAPETQAVVANTANPLDVAMQTTGSPNVGADDEGAATSGNKESAAKQILAAQAAATGAKLH